MHAAQRTSVTARRLRHAAAGILGTAALLFIWTGLGLSSYLPFPGAAVADAGREDNRAAALALVPEERAGLLQSTVDSVALGLGGALAAAPDQQARQEALNGALSALTFNLGGEVYFTAWQGTRIVHSPGSPDAAGLDFSGALDHRGAAFVESMEDLALKEGGFVRALLPRQMSAQASGQMSGQMSGQTPGHVSGHILGQASDHTADQTPGAPWPLDCEAAPDGQAAAAERSIVPVAGDFCPLDHGACPPRVSHTPAGPLPPVEQVVYVRRIPGSPWHIAAFMPASPAFTPGAEQAFSRLWPASGRLGAALAAKERFRQGLCFSGFSLAGLAGLLLVPAGRGQRPAAPEKTKARPQPLNGADPNTEPDA